MDNAPNSKTTQRIEWIDISKGIAILMVFLNHTNGMPLWVIKNVCIVHLPLFFIASGFTSKTPDSKEQLLSKIKKLILHTLLPCYAIYTFSYFAVWHFDDLIHFRLGLDNIKTWAFALLMSSGVPGSFLGHSFEFIGLLWFIPVYTLLRILYDCTDYAFKTWQKNNEHDSKKQNDIRLLHLLFVVLVTCGGVYLGDLISLPFSGDIVPAMFLFFYLGRSIKEKNIYSLPVTVICALVWIFGANACFMYSGEVMGIVKRVYPYFPVCYAAAAAGTVFIFNFSKTLDNLSKGEKLLKFVGRNTLLAFYIHHFDSIWTSYLFKPFDNVAIHAVIRIVSNVAILAVIVFIKDLFSKIKTAE